MKYKLKDEHIEYLSIIHLTDIEKLLSQLKPLINIYKKDNSFIRGF